MWDHPLHQPPPCCLSSLPWLPVSAPPTGLDECFFFISLVVRLHTVQFSVSSGCFLFLNLLLSFFSLCKEAQCVYLCLHLGWNSLLLNILFLRYSHVNLQRAFSLLFIVLECAIVCIIFYLISLLLIDIKVFYHYFAITNNAAMSNVTYIYIYLYTYIYLILYMYKRISRINS